MRSGSPCADGHAVEVVGRGLDADEDDLLALLGHLDGACRRRTRPCPTAAPGEAFEPCGDARRRGLGASGRTGRAGAGRRAPARSAPSASCSVMMPSSTMSAAIRTAAAAVRLAAARLEHVQPAALDRELEVLDVAVVAARAARRCARTRRRPRACSVCIWLIVGGVRMPATTSSPWALVRYSPKSTFSPVFGSRVKATPVPESSPMLPKTMVTTLTAVPRSWAIFCCTRGSRGRACRTS